MDLWETWEVRVLMLCSLSIQVLLTILAPYRKRCGSSFLSFFMWVLYLAADSVALLTIGLISIITKNSHKYPSQEANKSPTPSQKADLLAFWAPFLLLHLGGPDTITALALEDNELWHRHALQLVTQLVVTIIVFARTFRKHHNLWLPTVLMFFNGSIKYYERTRALYYASMENFRDSQRSKPEPGPNYARLMEEYSSAMSAYIPAQIKGKDGPPDVNMMDRSRLHSSPLHREVDQAASNTVIVDETDDVIREAYNFYDKFKGLLADAFLSLKERAESRTCFLKKSFEDAFKIVEIELNFIYDVFYTKVFLLQRKQSYVRLVCFFSVTASLGLFCKSRRNYDRIDQAITFSLLGGAIALDLLAVIMFILSDWWVITAYWDGRSKPLKYILMLLLGWSRKARGQCCIRWSQSISEYNLLKRCLKDPPCYFRHIFIKRILDLLIGWKYVETKEVKNDLVKFIFKELRTKAELADEAWANKQVCSARGNLVLEEKYSIVAEYFRPWTLDIDYDESLLTWHFATDICYWTISESERENKFVKFSKAISDYMSYLILRQQDLLSPVVGISDIRFDDTRAEVRKFASNVLMLRPSAMEGDSSQREEVIRQFCGKLLEVKADVQPMVAKGDKSKSVLFDSCRLAKELKKFGRKQWKITSKIWVELLCYAAVRCSPRAHVALLSKGGELITLVWLLMAHLGLGERFRQNRGFGWTKLIVDK